MSRIDKDLGERISRLLQVVQGLDRAFQAADGIVERVDQMASHLSDPGTVDRVVRAGVDALVDRASREIRNAAQHAHPGELLLTCGKHGRRPWAGTIVCGACGRVSQVIDPTAARFAPPVCACMRILLPVPRGDPGTALPICSVCYGPIAAGSGFAVRRSCDARRRERG
jgi:hypothetical protein